MDEEPRPLEVPEEPQPEPLALRRAGDQPGHVRDDEAPLLVEPDQPERRHEGRERVVGDLWRAADRRETSVDLPAFGNPTTPTSARRRSSRRSVRSSPASPGSARRGARFVEVAKRALPRTAPAAARHLEALPLAVRSPRSTPACGSWIVVPTGTRRTRSVAARAVAVGALAVTPARRGVVAAIAEVEEGAEAFVGLDDHRAAAASVPPVGPAPGDVLLTAEADAAPAAVAGPDVDLDFVDEHGGPGATGSGGS
jgi:hypothetical protein